MSNSFKQAFCRAAILLASSVPLMPTSGQVRAGYNPSRGELLYTTHCIACHTTQVHWRDRRLATDWPGLVRQVQRWQANTGQHWGDDDIAAVARYLNARYYHFEPDNGKAVSQGTRDDPSGTRQSRVHRIHSGKEMNHVALE